MALQRDNIFVDSNYFIALYNKDDASFAKASETNKKLIIENPRITISDYIFAEVVTVVSQRVGKTDAIEAGNFLRMSKHIEVVGVNHRIHEMAWHIFKQIKKKDMSYVDCTTLAVMQHHGVDKLLTFDKADFSSLQKKYHFTLF